MKPEIEFIRRIVADITGETEAFTIDRTVDDNGVLLTLHVPIEHAGRVIGREGVTAQSLRTLLRALGMKNAAKYTLKIKVGS